MRRRDFVWRLLAAGLAPQVLFGQQQAAAPPPAAPVPWTLGLNPSTPLPHTQVPDAVAESDLGFFTAEQMGTLRRLSDLLLPAIGSRPSALQAETPQFLDFLLKYSPASRQTVYKSGLDWLNVESKGKFHVAFADTTEGQADALVKPWMRTWMTDHPPTQVHADFLNIAHADIRTATMNSKVWNDATTSLEQDPSGLALYWSPIEPDIYATQFNSIHVRPSPVIDAPKASHTTPSYPR
jgi:hypothetical protein